MAKRYKEYFLHLNIHSKMKMPEIFKKLYRYIVISRAATKKMIQSDTKKHYKEIFMES